MTTPCSESRSLVSDEDRELGQMLVEAGWYSVSNKYYMIARWKEPVPRMEDLIRPELLNAPHVDRVIAMWNKHRRHETDLRSSHPLVEDQTLTASQYLAFRQAGGRSA